MDHIKRFLESEKSWVLLLWLLVLAERLAFTVWDHTEQSFIVSDSVYYYQSGLDLAKYGRLIYRGCPTALIMPGISALIGLLSLIFPDGSALLFAIRFVFIALGSLTPLYLYSSLRLFTGRWSAWLAAAVYLLPWHVQIDCFLLTECPYYLFFAMALYFTLRMTKDKSSGIVLRWALSILAALLFRPNILIFSAFSLIYLCLCGQYTALELSRRAATLCIVLAVFVLPWTLRNYKLYHSFIPISYGASNPLCEGTYQGDGSPTDEEIGTFDGHFNAYAAVAAKRPDLLDETGQVKNPEMQQYVDMLVAREIAAYRLARWFSLRPMSLIKAYLYTKPRIMLNWVWYYIELGGISYEAAHRLRQLGFLFCMMTAVLSFRKKKIPSSDGFPMDRLSAQSLYIGRRAGD